MRVDCPVSNALENLLDEIRVEVRATSYLTGRTKLDPVVMDALREVPRHLFLDNELQYMAYENQPLPIGHGQTISQPYIVALMTDLLALGKDDVVLEIGTGSGYQAAILAHLAKRVYSIEFVESLARQARERLSGIGCENVELRVGNGYFGWPEHAPYDAIMVTAAARRIPPALLEQLKPGGRMVIPVTGYSYPQQLLVVRKEKDGTFNERNVLPVLFVPLIEDLSDEMSRTG